MNNYKIVTLNLNPRRILTFRKSFPYRALAIQGFVDFNHPDIICIQGFEDWMLPSLEFLTDAYTFYGGTNNKRHLRGDYRNCILFLKEKFIILKGSTISLDASSSVTFAHLETIDTHQSLVIGNSQFKSVLPSKILSYKKSFLEFLESFPAKTNLIIAGDHILDQTMYQSLINNQFKTIPHSPIPKYRALIQEASKNYRPKDCIYLSHSLHLTEINPISSLYMGSFPSSTIPMGASFNIPLKTL